jgi:glutamate dehydrogenase/leucine dehydrogenase
MSAACARVVVSGANAPMTAEIEALLHRRGVLVVPDFIANAGGLICASLEYHGGTQARAVTTIEAKLRETTAAVLEAARARRITPRQAGIEMALARIEQTKRAQRSRGDGREHESLGAAIAAPGPSFRGASTFDQTRRLNEPRSTLERHAHS